MGIFKKFWKRSNSDPSTTISAADLEAAILSAYEKIEAKKAAELKDDNNLIAYPRGILLISFFIFAVLFIYSSIIFVLSFAPGISSSAPYTILAQFTISDLSTFNELPTLQKIVNIVLHLLFGIFFSQSYKAVKNEKDRAILISYFSAITSIAALMVAYQK